jgi:hypothetical protein
MSKKDGLIRVKVEYEETPIMDCKTHNLKDMDDIFKTIKKKLR